MMRRSSTRCVPALLPRVQPLPSLPISFSPITSTSSSIIPAPTSALYGCSSSSSSSIPPSSLLPSSITPVRALHVLRTIDEVRALRRDLAYQQPSKSSSSSSSSSSIIKPAPGLRVGLVPTMGALHAGHISLIEAAKKENDIVWCSIFVNPTQFAPHEDLDRYPRPIENDMKLLKQAGCHALFLPTPAIMYPPNYGTYVIQEKVDELSSEGRIRPGHFRGVLTVCTKLFNLVQPHNAYFGQKDGMQCIAIRRLVRELNLDTNIRICPTMRESTGLAMSSRNVYLKPEDREKGGIIYRSLQAASKLYHSDDNIDSSSIIVTAATLREAVRHVLDNDPDNRISSSSGASSSSSTPSYRFREQYISIADANTGRELEDDATLPRPPSPKSSSSLSSDPVAMVSIAVKVGDSSLRLIDNCILPSPPS